MTEEFRVGLSLMMKFSNTKAVLPQKTVLIMAVTKRKREKTKIHDSNIFQNVKITLCEII